MKTMSDARTVLAEWQQRTDAAGEWEAHFTGEAYTLRFQRPFPKYRAADGRVEYVNVESGGLALSILTAREAMPKLLAALRAVEALCEDDPYEVPFVSENLDGVLVSDIRKAINDALLASEPSGSER